MAFCALGLELKMAKANLEKSDNNFSAAGHFTGRSPSPGVAFVFSIISSKIFICDISSKMSSFAELLLWFDPLDDKLIYQSKYITIAGNIFKDSTIQTTEG